MARVIIDGYNLLAQSPFKSRDELISHLKNYRKEQDHEITIFFDGTHEGTTYGDRYTEEYVEIIFSPLNVTADELMEEYIEKNYGQNLIVISSDRRIQKAASEKRQSFLESKEFFFKMKHAASQSGRTISAPHGGSNYRRGKPTPLKKRKSPQKIQARKE